MTRFALAVLVLVADDATYTTKGGELSITVPSTWKSAPHPDGAMQILLPNDEFIFIIPHRIPWNATLAATLDAWLADSGRTSASRKTLPFGERIVTSGGGRVWDSVFYLRRSTAWEVRHVRRNEEASSDFDKAVDSIKLAPLPALPEKLAFEPAEGREAAFVAEAERLLAEFRPATPDIPPFEGVAGAYVRGLWLLRLNEPGRAEPELKKVLDENPRFAVARALHAEALRRMPANSRDEVERNAAAAYSEAATARNQDPALALPHVVLSQLERRKAYLENPKGFAPDALERVLAPLHTALELPDPPLEAYRLRAEIYELIKMPEPALFDYNRWLAGNPTDTEARERRDKLKADLGKRPIGKDPWNEGLRRYRNADYDGAVEAFNASPDTPALRRFRARACSRTGDWGRVGEDTTVLIARDPNDGEARDLRAFALYRLGKWQSASIDFEALLKIAPQRENELRPYVDACRRLK
jgi:tetratricopeptide (TPR) repeat protein